MVLLKIKHKLQKKCKEGRKVFERCVEEWTKALKFAQILYRMSKKITEEGKKAAKSAQISNQMSEQITHMSRHDMMWHDNDMQIMPDQHRKVRELRLHCCTLCFQVLEIIVDHPVTRCLN
jgi:hypothetical protein